MDLDALEVTTFGSIGVDTEFHFSAYSATGQQADLEKPGRARYLKTSAHTWTQMSDGLKGRIGSVRAKVWIDPLQ